MKELQGDVERACVMCKKLQEDGIYTKSAYRVLVGNIKDELC